jgi:hypothetical protein
VERLRWGAGWCHWCWKSWRTELWHSSELGSVPTTASKNGETERSESKGMRGSALFLSASVDSGHSEDGEVSSRASTEGPRGAWDRAWSATTLPCRSKFRNSRLHCLKHCPETTKTFQQQQHVSPCSSSYSSNLKMAKGRKL